jgi:hypothetical protein
LLRRSLAALHSQGINKCHLMVFGNNETGLKFWRGVAAQERVDLVLFSMATTGDLLRNEPQSETFRPSALLPGRSGTPLLRHVA